MKIGDRVRMLYDALAYPGVCGCPKGAEGIVIHKDLDRTYLIRFPGLKTGHSGSLVGADLGTEGWWVVPKEVEVLEG